PLGSLQNPGPAYVPVLLALLLLVFGVFVAALGKRAARVAEVGWSEWRHAVMILAVCAFMAWALDRLGYRITIAVALAFLIGVLPGVGPLAGISLLLPATFGLNATNAIVMLAGIYYGAMYGGSTTSILMRIPGEAASVMTCIDGYAMARKGRAGAALAIAAVGSYVAGTASVVGLMLLAPPLASFALRFGPPENVALLVLGLLVLAY